MKLSAIDLFLLTVVVVTSLEALVAHGRGLNLTHPLFILVSKRKSKSQSLFLFFFGGGGVLIKKLCKPSQDILEATL